MTVETELTKIIVDGNDTATVFSFAPIVVFQEEDLLVERVDASGVITTLVNENTATGYQITFDEAVPSTGSITYPADEVTPLPTGQSLIIRRIMEFLQPTDLENQGRYLAETQEQALDRQTFYSQQLKEQVDRALTIAVDLQESIDLTIPDPEPGAHLAWNDDGTALINVASLIGPQGEQGIQGEDGASGAGTGDMLAAQNLNDLANKATARTNLGVAIGTNVEAWSAKLDALAALTWANNKLPKFTSASAVSTIDFLDEDDLISDSATGVPSQQSTKAYVDAAIPANADYLEYRYVVASGTDGGTYTNGAYRTRPINTEVSDAGGHGSVASNQITLAVGQYDVKITMSASSTGNTKAKLRNVTDAADEIFGNNVFLRNAEFIAGNLVIEGKLTVTGSAKVFEVQMRGVSTVSNTGMGQACTFGDSEVYLVAKFWKVV